MITLSVTIFVYSDKNVSIVDCIVLCDYKNVKLEYNRKKGFY